MNVANLVLSGCIIVVLIIAAAFALATVAATGDLQVWCRAAAAHLRVCVARTRSDVAVIRGALRARYTRRP